MLWPFWGLPGTPALARADELRTVLCTSQHSVAPCEELLQFNMVHLVAEFQEMGALSGTVRRGS